jgi:hypothetical protein
MEWRFEKLTARAAELLHAGNVVYSPITHNHPIAIAHGLPRGWEFWEKFDTEFLRNASKLEVFMLPGWEESNGVMNEIRIAREFGVPIYYTQP